MRRPKSQTGPCFELRPGVAADYEFTLRLYVAGMKPLLGALDAWDETEMLAKFRYYFTPAEITIIQVDGQDAGWMQISETADGINLDQLHLEPAFQSNGIGTRIIRDLKRKAEAKNKPLLLSLVRGNRAVGLYERLGFKPDGSDRTKLHMRWDA